MWQVVVQLKDGVNVVGLFVPTDNINIAISTSSNTDDSSLDSHQVIFTGGPFPEVTKSLKSGDFITGFDSDEFESFVRRINKVVSSTASEIVLEVVSISLIEIYKSYYLSSNIAGNEHQNENNSSNTRSYHASRSRNLHEVLSKTPIPDGDGFGNVGNPGQPIDVIGDTVQTVTDIVTYLAEKAHSLGIHEKYDLPPSEYSLTDQVDDADTIANSNASLLFETRIIMDIHIEDDSIDASLSSDVEYKVTASYDEEV